MITLSVSELIKDTTSGRIFRILWIDEGSLITYVIEIHEDKALPFVMRVKDINQGIIDKIIIKVEDPLLNDLIGQENITDEMIKSRDKAWNIIKELVLDEPSIYKKRQRSQHINKLVSSRKCSKVTAYKYLRRYWQRGKTINCLLPDYKNRGAKGEIRKSGSVKRGRPRKTDSIGINVTEETRVIFKKAIKKYYFTSKKNSLSYAYKMMIKEFYANEIRYVEGVKHIVIQDENKIPSLRQFRYWYNKEFGLEQSIVNREGRKKFERDYRAILGSSTYEAVGPGSRYQIDATIGNIYIISSYNSDWIIGRPIIYFVVDVFTHMITGMYIGLEGPSWSGMMMAIANATIDKKEFCSNYGIHISEEMWPAAHLPEIIVGDRGELEGYNVNNLINGLNITIENNPPFRPDWKGIVEKLFDTSQEKIKPFLPGYIQPDYGERGAKDYRLDAKLNLEQYTKIIINFILHYNKNYYMKNYPRDKDMIDKNVIPTPIELWKWGIRNRAGKLRKANPNKIKFYLMPRDKATITAKGIKFKGMLYSCELALKESWFILARKNGTWKVDISYDPRNMNNIYIHSKGESLFETCSLLEHQERYQDRAIEDIAELQKNESQNYKQNEHNLLQEEINFFSNIESIVDESVEIANKTQSNKISNSQKTKSIAENRRIERSLQREKESFQLEKAKNIKDNDVIEFSNIAKSENESKKPSIKELFNKRRGRRDE